MNTHQNCLLCSSTRLKELVDFSAAHLCRCRDCGFVFSRAIPTVAELERHYAGYSRNDYVSPITIKRYNELLDAFEPYRKTNRLLDVGCGIGQFLTVAKRRGWEVHGTEFTPKAIDICESKGIHMTLGPLDPKAHTEENYDVITSFEVIEHINNPVEEIENFRTLLRPGGLAYVTTPNFNSYLRYRLKSKYDVITYPEHLSYYTKSTLKKAFKGSGFRALRVVATGISPTRLQRGLGTKPQALVSATSSDEVLRNKIENKAHLRVLKRVVNEGLSALGVGKDLKGWFLRG